MDTSKLARYCETKINFINETKMNFFKKKQNNKNLLLVSAVLFSREKIVASCENLDNLTYGLHSKAIALHHAVLQYYMTWHY
jgi:hypothetical protein